MEPTEKACSRCGEVKPFAAFWKQKDGAFGLQSHCKACRRATSMTKKIQLKRACLDCKADISLRGPAAKRCEPCGRKHDAQRDLSAKKALYTAHPEKKQAIQARYRARHPEKEAARHSKYQKANLERGNAAAKRYYQANREQVLAVSKGRRASNRERISRSYAAETLGLPVAQCTPELIELKREQLTLRRLTLQLVQELEKQNGN